VKPDVEVEVRPEPMELFSGDVLLQSSDGLTDLAQSADILATTCQALVSGTVSDACHMLVQLANNRGGHDNISVQMARIIEIGPKAPTTIPGGPPRASVSLTSSSQETVRLLKPAPSPVQAAALTPLAAPVPPQPAALAAASAAEPSFGMVTPGALLSSRSAPAAQSGGAAMSWAPVQPTATDATPPASARGIHGTQVMPRSAMSSGGLAAPGGPLLAAAPAPPPAPPGAPPMPSLTLNEPQLETQPWSPEVHGGPPGAPAMPPPAGMTGAAPPTAAPTPLAPPKDGSPGALPLPSALPQGFGAPAPTQVPYAGAPPPFAIGPASHSTPGAKPSSDGIIFVIIGLSAVIAVLLVILIWAVVIR
jgi:protein phosphatase